MNKNNKEKYNESCIKLFKFIHMLYNDNAEFKKVLDLISDGNYDGTSNTHVMLNKFLNALKIFGVNVKKIKNKYYMQTPLYRMNFDINDLKCISILKQAQSMLSSGNNKKQLENFIKNLEIRFDEETRNLSQIVCNINRKEILSPEIAEQMKLSEKYCQQKHKLEIVYNDESNEKINLLCTPIETILDNNKVYIKVLGVSGRRIYEIPMKNIKSAKQLPNVEDSSYTPTTIVYRIKNRLAKNYKMRDWENLEKIESNGDKIIVNKNEDFNLLLSRLMRYSTECEVISPKFFKEEMVNIINKTLSNYQ